MTEENKPTTTEPTATPAAAAETTQPQQRRDVRSGGGQGGGRGGRSFGGGGGRQGQGGQGGGRGGRGGGRGRGRGRDDKPKDEFDSVIIDLARVTRVMAGGKRMSFRACVVVGDKKGRIGMGVMKGADVQLAVAKATEQAKKRAFSVRLYQETIPHTVETKYKGARVFMKPAKPGTGIIAGGPTRVIMDLVGVKNIVAKMKGSGNKISNVRAVLEALESLQTREDMKSIKKQ